MRNVRTKIAIALACFCALATPAHTQAPLTITSSALEPCVVDQLCSQRLQTTGGVEPLQWRVARGSLPPGLQLDISGTISGEAASAGEYEVLIEVSDSSKPAQKVSRLFTTKSLPALSLDWKAPPTLQETSISGSVTVYNNGRDTMDLTVIIVAVNETGKAFALGYQRINLAAKTTVQEIPFQSQLPAGRYNLRADAVAEVPPRNRIYRSAREAGPFTAPAQ